MGRAARQSVESLSWDSVARETMQVYEELLASKESSKILTAKRYQDG
jgi:hypothetical protein